MATLVAAPPRPPKKNDALFGPNIGIVNSGPAWTDSKHKKTTAEELTPDVVQSWIARSKQPTQPTTTLQALVNLKRPTLRLTPLDVGPTDDPTHADAQHHHGLEFGYDCDAPRCGIYVHVLLSPDHPLADPSAAPPQSRVLVYESVVDGGFAKALKLDDGATLELGRYEGKRHRPTLLLPPPPVAAGTPVSSDAESLPQTPDLSSLPSVPSLPGSRPATGDTTNSRAQSSRRSRFSAFNFRRRPHRTILGPALAVVDAEAPAAASSSSGGKSKEKDEQADEGVKVTIRLAALDEQGTELALPNEQVTYLHVVRIGPPPAENQEDTRSWVVKVVKREATIGPHTFHLHEIYGLTSSTAPAVTPGAAPAPAVAAPAATAAATDPHTYPPSATSSSAGAAAHHLLEEEPSSECLLCLSAPREVVLLPCRHLVACKECALNMVEFGAGGSIHQPEADVPVTVTATATAPDTTTAVADADDAPNETGGDQPPAEGDAPAAGDGTPAATTTPTTTTPAPANANAAAAPAPVNPRRKRKAKGWFCPVCRQPYTSLLRITTATPNKELDRRLSTSGTEEAPAAAAAVSPSSDPPLQTPNVSVPAPTLSRNGLSAFRPLFRRNFSRTPSSLRDVEQGVAAA